MIYSHSCLLEPFVLQPPYETLAQSGFDKIKDHLSVTQGNNYATGRASVPTGLSYTISNVTSGEDPYVNTFTATLTTEPAPVEAGDGSVLNDGASGEGTSGRRNADDHHARQHRGDRAQRHHLLLQGGTQEHGFL
jgi:hypothetical protein